MKKLYFNVKKNATISLLVILALVLGVALIAYVTKTPNTKDNQVLSESKKTEELKVDEINTENEEKAKEPLIKTTESTEIPSQDKAVSITTEPIKKEEVLKKAETPKEKPKTQDNITDKNKVPTYTEKEVKQQVQTTPNGGEKNSKGQVYLPGFGWVNDEGGGGQGTNVTSNGDINKQVGKMD